MLPGPAAYVVPVAPDRGGLSCGAVAAFVGVAAAVSTLLKSRPGVHRRARASEELGMRDLEAMNGVFDPLQFSPSQPRVAMVTLSGQIKNADAERALAAMEGVSAEVGGKVW